MSEQEIETRVDVGAQPDRPSASTGSTAAENEAHRADCRKRSWLNDGPCTCGALKNQAENYNDASAIKIAVQAGSELDQLISLIRFAPGQPTGFLHSNHDANGLVWRWMLKWAKQSDPAAPQLVRDLIAALKEQEMEIARVVNNLEVERTLYRQAAADRDSFQAELFRLRSQQLTDDSAMLAGIRRYLQGEQIGASTDIADMPSYGYGALDKNGFWEFPVPTALVDWKHDVDYLPTVLEKFLDSQSEIERLRSYGAPKWEPIDTAPTEGIFLVVEDSGRQMVISGVRLRESKKATTANHLDGHRWTHWKLLGDPPPLVRSGSLTEQDQS